MKQHRKVGLLFLAGGIGSRFGGSTPKQYQLLQGKEIALHAFNLFQNCPEIGEIVVVCEPEYQKVFLAESRRPIMFAVPGLRRQDSVANGFAMLSETTELVCIHDAARPFPSKEMVREVLEAAETYGAATVGMPIKYTLKKCDEEGMVEETPDRSLYWEIQTPQALHYDILQMGLSTAQVANITVTDDTSLAELVGFTVKVVKGSYSNIKITTPEDIIIAESLHVRL